MDKVIDIEERIPTLREQRRKRTNRKFVALLFIFLTLLAVLLYSQSKYSDIQKITVSGASLFEEKEYVEASGLKQGDSMWSFDAGSIAEQLNSLQWVENASVSKNWPTGVEIAIEEFQTVGYIEQGDGYQKVLSNGYAIEKQSTAAVGPVFSGFETEETREELAVQLKELDSEVYNLISQAILTEGEAGTEYVTLYMTDGNEVHAILNSLAEKMNYYPSVISQLEKGRKGIIDMEVGIYFRPYEDVYGPPEEGVTDEESEGE